MTFDLQPTHASPDSSSGSTASGAVGWAWYAVQTRPAAEEVAAETLRTLELETVLPRVQRLQGRGSTASFRRRPLFPGYLFVRCHPERHLHAIRYSRGVIRLVGGRESPAPIEDAVIEAFRGRMDDSGCVELDEPGFQRGDRVQIESGPFRGLLGVFERGLEDHVRVVILLEALQQAQLVLDRRCLSRVGA